MSVGFSVTGSVCEISASAATGGPGRDWAVTVRSVAVDGVTGLASARPASGAARFVTWNAYSPAGFRSGAASGTEATPATGPASGSMGRGEATEISGDRV